MPEYRLPFMWSSESGTASRGLTGTVAAAGPATPTTSGGTSPPLARQSRYSKSTQNNSPGGISVAAPGTGSGGRTHIGETTTPPGSPPPTANPGGGESGTTGKGAGALGVMDGTTDGVGATTAAGGSTTGGGCGMTGAGGGTTGAGVVVTVDGGGRTCGRKSGGARTCAGTTGGSAFVCGSCWPMETPGRVAGVWATAAPTVSKAPSTVVTDFRISASGSTGFAQVGRPRCRHGVMPTQRPAVQGKSRPGGLRRPARRRCLPHLPRPVRCPVGTPFHQEGIHGKDSCPNPRQQFRPGAKPVEVTINGAPMPADAREFSTRSLGWYLNGKTVVDVNGQKVTVQVGVNLTIVGSKELQKDGAGA